VAARDVGGGQARPQGVEQVDARGHGQSVPLAVGWDRTRW
jgi:hypothetical protein